MKIIYIGSFPPPYGGVTIKNNILYENLERQVKIEKINLVTIKKKNLKELWKFCKDLLKPKNIFVIGVAARARKNMSRFLFYFNRNSMNHSILIVMGGMASHNIASDSKYQKWIKEYKQIFVETRGMQSELNVVGVMNVSIFPNCRERMEQLPSANEYDDKKLRCLYFSLISKDKGVNVIFEALDILDKESIDYSIDLYGHIDDLYQDEFKMKIASSDRANYCGVFTGNQENVIKKLRQYDVLLLPTKCKTEGVPGVLIEAKIASLPSIVSNICYNAEIVEDGVSGIVMKENNAEALAVIIKHLHKNNDILSKMKVDAGISAEYYYINNYIDDIVNILKDDINGGLF